MRLFHGVVKVACPRATCIYSLRVYRFWRMIAAGRDSREDGRTAAAAWDLRRMIRYFVLTAAAAALVGCGQARTVPEVTRAAISSSGVIGQACSQSTRPGVSPRLCGCIQMVADQTLSRADQSRAGPFFADPDAAHAVRLSDTPRDDAFWARWTDFAEAAEGLCAAYR